MTKEEFMAKNAFVNNEEKWCELYERMTEEEFDEYVKELYIFVYGSVEKGKAVVARYQKEEKEINRGIKNVLIIILILFPTIVFTVMVKGLGSWFAWLLIIVEIALVVGLLCVSLCFSLKR